MPSKNRDDTKHRSNKTKFIALSFFLAPLYFKPARATAKMPADPSITFSIKQQPSLKVAHSMQL